IDRICADAGLEVQAVASPLPAHRSQLASRRYFFPHVNIGAAQVRAHGVEAPAVIDDHSAAVVAVAIRKGNPSRIYGAHGGAERSLHFESSALASSRRANFRATRNWKWQASLGGCEPGRQLRWVCGTGGPVHGGPTGWPFAVKGALESGLPLFRR